jgi:chemotaxis regulatin CheY-phosphate phosphatase CheZ
MKLFDEETDILNEIGELERNLNERLKGLKVERLFNFGFVAY